MRAAQAEFPGFPEETAERTESALALYLRLSRESGGLIPQSMLPGALGLSSARVCDFISEKRFHVHQIGGKNFVTADSFEAFLLAERKAGRPLNNPTVKQMAKATGDFLADNRKSKK
jgi:hypothetical protein